MTRPLVWVVCCAIVLAAAPGICNGQAAGNGPTTAWRDGVFHVDVAGVMSRSDVILAKPNLEAAEAMPLGNGRLGAAAWSADGMTVQLNREDTMPDRLSAGQLVIPGLAALTHASDYTGRLDLYHEEFRESGAGMSATVFVEPDSDALVVDVTGAKPGEAQTALLRLWTPRTPKTTVQGETGLLTEAWVDDKRPEASGRPFGSLACITALGRDVVASVVDPLTVKVSFRPDDKGHFRVLVAVPRYDGTGEPATLAAHEVIGQPESSHRTQWESFWNQAAMIRIDSRDGSGEYMENLRNLYLYVAACEKGTEYPGSQAGVADMISAGQDDHRWDPSAFWHWNLRMQVAANLGAGLSKLNAPYFSLYRNNLANIEAWTRKHMRGLPGSCVPETMRFNGRGIEYEAHWSPVSMGLDCDADFKPYYNARTLSTGAEVSMWVWEQFLATGDRAFLEQNYSLMASSARFLLAYEKEGPDGLLHTGPANAHENQWDVVDPITDLAAIKTLYPEVIEAARILNRDHDLAQQLESALEKTPDFPRTNVTGPHTLLTAAADASGNDVIADSYWPDAEEHNIENLGLEPVWPYGLIGDSSPLFELARRTYAHRPSPTAVDWSYDPIQAARLELGSEVGSTLKTLTEKFQHYVNGMAQWENRDREFYIEQAAVVADSLQEALVQDYDGVIRIAPAIPPGWDFAGSVFVRDRTRVDVQTRDGRVETVVVEPGSAHAIHLKNPWPGQRVHVEDATGQRMTVDVESHEIVFEAKAGERYRLLPENEPKEKKFEQLGGLPASTPKKLGPVQIGIF